MTDKKPQPHFGLIMLTALGFLGGCPDIPANSTEKNDLASMANATINVVGRTTYTAYVADSSRDDGKATLLGLMNITESELPEDRGMIFIFPDDQHRSFWMRNTIIPLDIAYIRSDGTIVSTYTMTPLREVVYSSIEPARFALEVRAGQFARWGIAPGDRVVIPAELTSD